MLTLEQIESRHLRVKAEEECKALFGKYIQLYMENRTREIGEMFAERADSTLEMPWGCYDGYEGIMRCFTVDHVDAFAENSQEMLAGVFCRPLISTPVIEVAGDMKTARGRMIYYGQDTFGTNNEREDYRNKPMWYAGFVGIDFIYDGGEWKFWHMWFSPAFLAPHETCATEWETENPHRNEQFFRKKTVSVDRPAQHPVYNWSPNAVYADCAPEMVQPYESFDQVAPGYGYAM